MTSENNNNPSQRYTAYRAIIPFYILYDLDLNSHHLRLYGQIEQLESNPDPKVRATFSYSWMAEQLGINRRNAIKTAKLLIDKGYIEHIEVAEGKYIWKTKKAEIDHRESTDRCRPETPPSVAQRHPPSVAERHPKIPKDKIPKDNLKTIVDLSKSTDYREDNFFMAWYCIYPLKEKPQLARKAFYKLKPNQEFVDMLIADTIKRKNTNWKNRPKDKIPHPSTYLNQRQWEGEIYEPENNQQNKSTTTGTRYRSFAEITRDCL